MSLNDYRDDSHSAARKGGWWAAQELNSLIVPTKITLIHSELSEAMEGHRQNLMDRHLPHRPSIEVELVDALIRIFDLAGFLGCDLEGAYREKRAYNEARNDHTSAARSSAHGKRY